MEYVPNKPVVIPKQIVGKDKRIVHTDGIFKVLRQRYENRFNQFLTEGLHLPFDSKPAQIIDSMESFMANIEESLDSLLPETCIQKKV